MPYQPLAVTNVTSTLTAVLQRGFGTLCILDENNQFLERTKVIYPTDSLSAIFPSDSQAYLAVTAAFSVSPKPEKVMVGRRTTNATLTVGPVIVGTVSSVTIRTSPTTTQAISFTAAGTDSAVVAAALVTAINGNGTLSAQLTASSTSNVVTLTRKVNGNFSIDMTGLANLTIGKAGTTELPSQAMNAIQAETFDFFAIVSTDRTSSAITDLATWVSTRDNVLFYATSDNTLYAGALNPASTNYVDVLKIGGAKYACPVYTEAASLSLYPEVRVFASKANYQPGDVIYGNITDLGVGPAKKTDGTLLSNAELGYLSDRGVNYFEYSRDFGFTMFRRGFSQGAGVAAWIDDYIGGLLVKARCNEAVAQLLVRQGSTKIGGSVEGYSAIQSAIETALNTMKTSVGGQPRLLRDFKIYIPKAKDITAAMRQGRVAKIKVKAWLEGALDSGEISVELAYE